MFASSNLFRAWLAGSLLILASGARAMPDIQTWETSNGARVLYVAAADLPILDVRAVFDAGSARDAGQSGLASLTASMLSQGAGDWSADTVAERLEDVGADLSVSADRDMTAVALRTLTRQPAMDTAVDTLVKILAAPAFAPDDLERVRRNTLIGLRQDEESPQSVGQKAFFRQVFGDHPYAADPSGTAESVSALTRDDLVRFHRAYYTAANAVVAIVGAVDRAGAEALAERLTAGLPRGERPPELPPVADLTASNFDQVAFPSSQTHVLAGEPGMRRGDPDYFPLYVGNHILGGSGLVSLLMEEVREKRGLSYSVYSYFLPLARPGPFLMGLQTKNDQADQARQVMLDTLRRYVETGPSEEELVAAKKNLTGGFPLRIASNADIVQYLAVIGFYGLPLDYLNQFTRRVESVTTEQIRDAFSRRVHPDRLAIVTVGGGGEQTAANGGGG